MRAVSYLLVGFLFICANQAQGADKIFCREVTKFSRNQDLSTENLHGKINHDTYMTSTSSRSQCKHYSDVANETLREKCIAQATSGRGLPAKAQLIVQWFVNSTSETLRTYTAYCQDLVTDTQLYFCNKFDKVNNVWVANPDPICNPGGDGDGDGDGDIGGP
ncbi:MAG: hypothetical protein IT288_05430 [Bdellovibrionales bacterium]|nr:hypothetical protein [Bdellovibrionales bacterium]